MSVPADSRIRQIATLDITEAKGTFEIAIAADSKELKDRVVRTTTVAPSGFPFDLYASGLLK